MIRIAHFVFNELGENSFVLYDDSGKCLIVDPGCTDPKQQQKLKKFLHDKTLIPEYILLTHGHFDHVSGVAWAKSAFSCPVAMHRDDLFLLNNATQHAGLFGFTVDPPPVPDRYIIDGEVVAFGNSEISIIHVPGHSPGSVCLYSANDNLLICGDVLFSGSIGRTDLFGGDHALLIRGIREKLMVLPRETVVWPGHGPKTTIGHEYDTNPFLT
jgi:hydroxyacylglutathione hydrolase